MRSTPHRRANRFDAWRRATACLALGALSALAVPAAHAQATPQHRPGRVLIIRGAFTVFSLGLDTLGDELEAQGIDVKVVPAYQATGATQELAELHGRRPEPIVIIGHSKGGLLAAQCAEQLAKSHVPVALIVVVDNPHAATVPANVRRCVNFYQTNWLGVVQGALLKAESTQTELLNVNIEKLPQRDEGGYIDHFNIDASPWVHSMIVQQVVRACPVEAAAAEARSGFGGTYRLARPSRPVTPQPTRRAMRPPPAPGISGGGLRAEDGRSSQPQVPSRVSSIPGPGSRIPRHNPLSERDIKVMR